MTNSLSNQVESVDRHTLGVDVDRHQLRPKKVHETLEFQDMEICPEDFSIFIISPCTFLSQYI